MTRIVNGAVFALLLATSALPAMGQPENLATRSKILSVQAKPYNANSGKIENAGNLFDPRQAVRNYIFESGHPSDSRRTHFPMSLGTPITYVEVEISVSSKTSPLEDADVLEIKTHSSGSDSPLIQRVSLAMFNMRPPQVLHIPFLLYDQSCNKLDLDVRIINGKQTLDEKYSEIPFSCGD